MLVKLIDAEGVVAQIAVDELLSVIAGAATKLTVTESTLKQVGETPTVTVYVLVCVMIAVTEAISVALNSVAGDQAKVVAVG